MNSEISDIISKNLLQFAKPGVISLRAGYEQRGGLFTGREAVIVNVKHKRTKSEIPADELLSESVDTVPVDVREASPLEIRRALNPQDYGTAADTVRPEFESPEFAGEIDVNGKALQSAEEIRRLSAAKGKPEIPYSGPAGVSLIPVSGETSILCSVSPDNGWSVLRNFFDGTEKSLTVGMYDFTSAHVLQEVQKCLKNKRLCLVLDHPAPNETSDQTDEETVQLLKGAVNDFSHVWALERNDPKVSSWIYPSAYHIKAAVRDSSVFWLSSGNWNNSNQPESAGTGGEHVDRDWHVVVTNNKLADILEKYLLNDLDVAGKYQAEGFASRVAPVSLEQQDTPVPRKHSGGSVFAPEEFSGKMSMQLLLTPDNYSDNVLKFINSVEKTFYMQTQYIHLRNSGAGTKLSGLVDAVACLIKRGVDVRIIVSQYGTGKWLELIKDAGIDFKYIRWQQNVHNKGMIIDSSGIIIGSQNWSSEGVDTNRDASLKIENADIAGYFQRVFLDDWDHRADTISV